MTISPQKVVSCLLCFVILTTISIHDISFQYIALIIVTCFFIGMANLTSRWPKFKVVDVFVLMPLFVWVYGVLLGILNSNSPVGIVRNFAGMLFYLTYFFMVFSKISHRKIISIIVKSSLIYLSIVVIFLAYVFITKEISVDFTKNGTASVRFYYSTGLAVLIPTLFIYMSQSSSSFSVKYRKFSLVNKNNYIVISIFLVIFFSGSKGFYLSVLPIVAIFFSTSIWNTIRKLKVKLLSLVIFCSSLGFTIYFSIEISSIIDTIISLELDDDHPRVIQKRQLIGDFTIFGRGLGGVIPGGYSRDVLGYGFELSFHSIIHKFGFMSIFIFVSFLAPIIYSIKKIIYRKSNVYTYLPLIFMLYLLPASGNPIIFAPVCVCLHCVALYLIRLDEPTKFSNV